MQVQSYRPPPPTAGIDPGIVEQDVDAAEDYDRANDDTASSYPSPADCPPVGQRGHQTRGLYRSWPKPAELMTESIRRAASAMKSRTRDRPAPPEMTATLLLNLMASLCYLWGDLRSMIDSPRTDGERVFAAFT